MMDSKSEGPKEEATVATFESNTLLELKNIFPHPVTTSKGSVIFAKQFTVLALSLITYTRGIFPAHAFSEKIIEGYAIKVLSGRRVCFDAHLFTKWLKSAFTALEKGYMKELIFEVVSLENMTLEYYSVLYEYKGHPVTCSVSGADETVSDFDETSFQRSVSRLISSVLRFAKKMESLPETYKLQLRILYYDEKTPENFIPDYFRDGDLESYEKTRTYAEPLARVDTPYHGIKMKIGSCYGLESYGKREKKIENPSGPRQTERKRKLPVEHEIGDAEEKTPKTVVACPPQMKLTSVRKTTELNAFQSKMQENTKSPSPSVPKVAETKPCGKPSAPQASKVNMNCVCTMNADKTGIFQCFKCTDWHHLICYRRKPTSVINPSNRVACVKCASENHDSECLDASFVSKKVPLKIIEKVAVFRQVVFKLRWFALTSASNLVEDCHVREDQAKLLIEKLVKKKLLSPCTRSGDYNVHTSELIAFINGYFR